MELRFPPFREAVICLGLIPIMVISTYVISSLLENKIYFYVGIALTGALLIWPVWIATALFLLWKNPRKYKEYDMKKRRRERERSSEDK